MKRALLLVVPILALVACSDDDDAPEVTSADVTSTDVATPEVSAPERTEPELTLPDDISIPDDITIPDDISIPDNISIPDLSMPENAGELIGRMFPQLDEEQIDCLVDAAEELGGEVTDQGQLLDYLDECNIDASDLLGGG